MSAPDLFGAIHSSVKKHLSWSGEVAQWTKTLAAKSDRLSSIPGVIWDGREVSSPEHRSVLKMMGQRKRRKQTGGRREEGRERTLLGPQRGPDPGWASSVTPGIVLPKTQKFYQASAGHEMLQEKGRFEYIL